MTTLVCKPSWVPPVNGNAILDMPDVQHRNAIALLALSQHHLTLAFCKTIARSCRPGHGSIRPARSSVPIGPVGWYSHVCQCSSVALQCDWLHSSSNMLLLESVLSLDVAKGMRMCKWTLPFHTYGSNAKFMSVCAYPAASRIDGIGHMLRAS